MTCTHTEDSEEMHLMESSEVTKNHRFELMGLRQDSTYACELHSTVSYAKDCANPVLTEVTTPPLDADIPTFTATRNEKLEMSGAYTMFNDSAACIMPDTPFVRLIILDPEANIRWVLPLGDEMDNDFDFALIGEDTVHYGGGWALLAASRDNRGIFSSMTLQGEVLHERHNPDFGEGFNHHSEYLPNGTYLSSTGKIIEPTDGTRAYTEIAFEIWDPKTQSVSYSWDAQENIDAGRVSYPRSGPGGNHYSRTGNALAWVDDALGPAIYVHVYQESVLWRIDRKTKEITHIIGHGHDFTLISPEGDLLNADEWFYQAHAPEFSGDGLVLFHDNGVSRPSGAEYSRVVQYQIDYDAMTVTKLWDWTEPDWFNVVCGDVDELPNGNVMVTKSYSYCITDQEDVSALVEFEPVSGEVVWRMNWDDPERFTYRSERVDGCDMFSNAKYCDALIDRLEELHAGNF